MSLVGAGLIACQTLKAWPEQTQPTGETPVPPTVGGAGVSPVERLGRSDCFGDPLPHGALARMGTTRLRHANQVNSVLFAPDGKTVASGGLDDTVRLWDVVTGKLVRSLKHPRSVWLRPASFAPDGKTLISLPLELPHHPPEESIGLWDLKTSKLCELTLKSGQNQQVFALAISSDGKTAVSGERNGVIRLWDAATGNPLRVLEGHKKLIRSLSFSPDNKILASVGEGEKVVQLWEVPSGKLLHKLEHPQMVWTVAFSPDGKTLASGGNDLAAIHCPRCRLKFLGGRSLLRGRFGLVVAVFSPFGGRRLPSQQPSTGTPIYRLWRCNQCT